MDLSEFKSVRVIKNWKCFNCELIINKGDCVYVNRKIIDYNCTKDNSKSNFYLCNLCFQRLNQEDSFKEQQSQSTDKGEPIDKV